MDAFGTTAPVLSYAVPAITPEVLCATAAAASVSRATANTTWLNRIRSDRCMMSSSLKRGERLRTQGNVNGREGLANARARERVAACRRGPAEHWTELRRVAQQCAPAPSRPVLQPEPPWAGPAGDPPHTMHRVFRPHRCCSTRDRDADQSKRSHPAPQTRAASRAQTASPPATWPAAAPSAMAAHPWQDGALTEAVAEQKTYEYGLDEARHV